MEDIYIPELSDEITVSLEIPDSVPADGVAYTMLRYHNGQASALPTSVSGGKVTFNTADFSTYALAYEENQKDVSGDKTDTPAVTKDNKDNISVTAPQTGDDTSVMTMVLLMLSSVAAAAIAYSAKRKLNK